MNMMYHTIALLLSLFSAPAATLALGPHNGNAFSTLWTFPNETWIEKLAIRSNGVVLCTSLSRAAIYQVNPFSHVAETVHQFPRTDGVLGISEIARDIFAVVTANVSLVTNEAWPGSAKIWRVDVGAWEVVSIVC